MSLLQHKLQQRERRLLLCLAVALSVAFLLGGLWPFAWRAPRLVDNAAKFTDDGTLRLSQAGMVHTSTSPEWVARAIQSHQLRLELRLRSFADNQANTARIFTLSRDPSSRNLTVGQDGSDLVLRLRRGRLYNGLPDYRVASVFESDDWHDVEILVTSNEVTVRLDGVSVLTERLAADPLAHWNRRFRITMGNEYSGNRPWLGEIARAVVQVGGDRFDHLHAADRVIPTTFIAGRQRDFLCPLSDSAHRRDVVLDLSINFLIFVPIGFLYAASLPWRPTWVAILICVALSLSVEVGQLFLEHRMTSGVDLIVNTIGGAVGAVAGRRSTSHSAHRSTSVC